MSTTSRGGVFISSEGKNLKYTWEVSLKIIPRAKKTTDTKIRIISFVFKGLL